MSKKAKVLNKAVKCPQCKSIKTEYLGQNKKGFSVGKAVLGGMLTAGVGTLAGFAGKKGKYTWHCNECGCMFETKK